MHLTITTDAGVEAAGDTLGEAALAITCGTTTAADGEAYLPEFQLQIEDDPRFATAELRRQHAAELSSVITEALRNRTQQEWVDLFEARGVPHEIRTPAGA